MRRIISVLLAITMLFSCGMVAMAEEAATPAVGIEEMDFLAKLGVMDADADPEATITRAEMAKIVMMCLGQNANVSPMNTPFTDVNISNKYSGYIQLANSANIMVGSGDGTFDPDGSVTYNQMVKLLTHAIGHEIFAYSAGGYPGGYLITGMNNGMLNGTTPAGEQAVSHGVAAVLIKNALEIELYNKISYGDSYKYESQEDVTALSRYFNIYKYTGIVTANHYASLSGTSSLKADEILFDDVAVLKVGDTNAADYLGYMMDLYVHIETNVRNKTIIAAYPDTDATTVIPGGDVMDKTTESVLYYETADEEEEIKIDANADMIYNGSSKFWSAADLKGNFGDITAIDNDNDGDVDVFIVYNYRNVIVDSVKAIDNIVRTKDETVPEWQSIVIDPESKTVKTTFVNTDGEDVTVEDLEEWNVISIAISENGDVMKAILCDEFVEGQIVAFDEETVTVGETDYKYDATKVTAPSAADFGREGAFYLDFAGRISAIDFEGATADMDYGYLKAAAVSGTGFNKKAEVELLVEGGLEIFELAKEVKLNGTKIDKEAVVADETITSDGATIQQLIMYKQDDEGKITAIKTAKSGSEMSEEERMSEFTLDHESTTTHFMYLEKYRMFTGGYMLSADTKVFIVPTALEMPTAEDEDYYMISVGAIANWTYMYMDKVTYYDINEDYEAGAVILDYEAGAFDKGNASAGTNGLVTGISRALNDDEEEVTRITLLNNAGKEVTMDFEADIKVSTTSTTITDLENEDEANLENGSLKAELETSALKVGDYVSYGYNQRGKLDRISLLFRAGNAPAESMELDKTTLAPPTGPINLYDANYLAYATIDRVAKNAIIMTPDSTERIVPIVSTTKYFKYDTKTKKISFITKADISDGDMIFFDFGNQIIIWID